jgi:hypothetical protein
MKIKLHILGKLSDGGRIEYIIAQNDDVVTLDESFTGINVEPILEPRRLLRCDSISEAVEYLMEEGLLGEDLDHVLWMELGGKKQRLQIDKPIGVQHKSIMMKLFNTSLQNREECAEHRHYDELSAVDEATDVSYQTGCSIFVFYERHPKGDYIVTMDGCRPWGEMVFSITPNENTKLARA